MPIADDVVHIFYSWQSDSPEKVNLKAIRTALGQACKRLSAAAPEIKLVPDEATRDTSGSPNIALKILEKIDRSAIFIADITTITPEGAARPCPNPNVTYELGYAVAALGWDRIILLFNKAIGQFPSDLPFDVIQNRASPYQYAESDLASKRDDLRKLLEVAIKAVLDKNPKRPAELKGLSAEKIEHDRDVENMRWLMGSLHQPTIQNLIEELPRRIPEISFFFFEGFRGIVQNNLFHVYDPILHPAVDSLCTSWTEAISHDGEYHETSSGMHYVFTNPGDMPLSPDRQRTWDFINAARAAMATSLQTILDRLRSAFIEIDLHETNAKAWSEYVAFRQETKRLMQADDEE